MAELGYELSLAVLDLEGVQECFGSHFLMKSP